MIQVAIGSDTVRAIVDTIVYQHHRIIEGLDVQVGVSLGQVHRRADLCIGPVVGALRNGIVDQFYVALRSSLLGQIVGVANIVHHLATIEGVVRGSETVHSVVGNLGAQVFIVDIAVPIVDSLIDCPVLSQVEEHIVTIAGAKQAGADEDRQAQENISVRFEDFVHGCVPVNIWSRPK